MTDAERIKALLEQNAALEHDNASLRRALETAVAGARRAGYQRCLRDQAEARRKALATPRQLGGGLSLVQGGEWDQRPPDEDFDQSPRGSTEAA